MKWIVLIINLFLFIGVSHAQLVVDTSLSPLQMAQTLIGGGVTISNVTMHCPNGAYGGFTATATNLGMNAGIILTSGKARNAIGPNSSTNISYDNTVGGDIDLNNIVSPDSTLDACSLEFDVFVKYDTLIFNYVFGSDEYEEFVNQFNDVFGLFISGPGIVGNPNIALVPGSSTFVSINNINCAVNSAYYTCNDANSIGVNSCVAGQCPAQNSTTTIEYDGFTKVLQAKIPVLKCNTYHIKLAVADVNDHAYDSGILIEAGSLSSVGVKISSTTINGNNYPNCVEGCLNGQFLFERKNFFNSKLVVRYVIGGNATNGVDYNHIADSVVFLPGDTSKKIFILPINDGVSEPNETVQLYYTDSSCLSVSIDTITLIIQDPLKISLNNDTTICTMPYQIIGTTSGSIPPNTLYNYVWTPAANILSGANSNSPMITMNNGTILFKVAVTNIPNCISSDSVKITLVPGFNIRVSNDTATCPSEPISLFAMGGVSYNWSAMNGSSLSCTTCNNPIATIQSSDLLIVKIIDSLGCSLLDTIAINLLPCPHLVIPSAFSPNGDNANDYFFPLNPFNYCKVLSFEVYDRWGEKVFQTIDSNSKGWDGTYKGKLMPAGVYIYTCRSNCGAANTIIEQKGNVQLLH